MRLIRLLLVSWKLSRNKGGVMTQTKKERAKSKNIIEVAEQLGIELKRTGNSYKGKFGDHESFVFIPDRNYFYWNGRNEGGDVIRLVEVIKGFEFKEAVNFLLDELNTSYVDLKKIPKSEPYVHKIRDLPLTKVGRDFLKNERQLSDETIDFFIDKNVLYQTNWYNKIDGSTEPVLIFKNYDFEGNVLGASVQGIIYDIDKHKERGRIKYIMSNSKCYAGITVDVGDKNQFKNATKENPFTIYAFESSLDLMAYYEIHKETLGNARLVAMEGKKFGAISAEVVDALISSRAAFDRLSTLTTPENYLAYMDNEEWSRENLKIVCCVDNDKAGIDFVMSNKLKNTVIVPHLPPLNQGMVVNDWNDQLKYLKSEKLLSKPLSVSEASVTSVKQAETFEMTM